MALINSTLPGLYGGVSQQTPSLRHDTQVSEMINCYPTVIGGVAKRPPTTNNYNDNTFPTDAFIYAYDRGSGNEQYIIAINSFAAASIINVTIDDYITPTETLASIKAQIPTNSTEGFSLSDTQWSSTNAGNDYSASFMEFTSPITGTLNWTVGSEQDFDNIMVFKNSTRVVLDSGVDSGSVSYTADDTISILYTKDAYDDVAPDKVTFSLSSGTLTNSVGKYRVFDIITNKWLTSEWTTAEYLSLPSGVKAKDSFSMTTVGDTSYVVNKTKNCAMTYNSAIDDEAINQLEIIDTFVLKPLNESYSYIDYANENGEDRTVYVSKYTLDGTLTVSISIDFNGITRTYSYSTSVYQQSENNFTGSYDITLAVKQALAKFVLIDVSNSSNDVTVTGTKIQAVKLMDNLTMTVSFTGKGSTTGTYNVLEYNENADWENVFYYWVKRTAGDASDNASLRYTYYIYDNNDNEVPSGGIVGHNSTTVASQLASGIGGVYKGSVVRKEVTPGQRYSGADSWGNQASESWQGSVKKLQDLPTDFGYEGAVIEITGDEDSAFDNYYVKYDGGVYLETVRPNLINYIDASTMPHQIGIRRNNDGTYTNYFDIIDWEERKVGDEDSAGEPSFIGQPIQDVFFYRNRLGFITGDNVVLSESGEYYNFWPTTVTSVIDSDVIDVAVDSNQAITLKYATPFNKELLIFGDKAQFVMSAGDVLTPTDVSVQQSTAFNIKAVEPVVLGPNAYFATEKNNFSNVREYYVQPDSLSNDAANITAHCPNYLPKNITVLTGSSSNDMLFALSSETPDTVYVYNFYWNGEEKAQSAWHKWTFTGNIFNIKAIGSTLLVMIQREDDNINLETIPLEYVTDFSGTMYLDGGVEAYESSITLTRPGFPTGNAKIDDSRGTLILRNLKVNADYGSLYNVTAYRFNKPRNYYYNSGVGQYPNKDYISSKSFNYTSSEGTYPSQDLVPSTELLPGTTTYVMKTDHKYSVTGNRDNLDIVFTNDISAGFRINSLDLVGTYVKNSRNV